MVKKEPINEVKLRGAKGCKELLLPIEESVLANVMEDKLHALEEIGVLPTKALIGWRTTEVGRFPHQQGRWSSLRPSFEHGFSVSMHGFFNGLFHYYNLEL